MVDRNNSGKNRSSKPGDKRNDGQRVRPSTVKPPRNPKPRTS